MFPRDDKAEMPEVGAEEKSAEPRQFPETIAPSLASIASYGVKLTGEELLAWTKWGGEWLWWGAKPALAAAWEWKGKELAYKTARNVLQNTSLPEWLADTAVQLLETQTGRAHGTLFEPATRAHLVTRLAEILRAFEDPALASHRLGEILKIVYFNRGVSEFTSQKLATLLNEAGALGLPEERVHALSRELLDIMQHIHAPSEAAPSLFAATKTVVTAPQSLLLLISRAGPLISALLPNLSAPYEAFQQKLKTRENELKPDNILEIIDTCLVELEKDSAEDPLTQWRLEALRLVLQAWNEDPEAFLQNPPMLAYAALRNQTPRYVNIPVFLNLTRNLQTLTDTIETTLEKALDPLALASVKRHTRLTGEDHYDETYRPALAEDPLFYYSNLALLSRHMKEAMPHIGQALTDLAIVLDENRDITERADALLNLIALIKPLNEHFFDGAKPAFERLEKFVDIAITVPGMEDMQKLANALLPIQALHKSLHSNTRLTTLLEVLSSSPKEGIPLSEHEAALRDFRKVLGELGPAPEGKPEASEAAPAKADNTLNHVFTRAIKGLSRLTNSTDEIPPETRIDIGEALNALQGIYDEFNRYNATTHDKSQTAHLIRAQFTLFSYLLQNIPHILKLYRHGSQAYTSLLSTFHDDFLSILNEINSLCCETCLKVDRVETECLLQEGTLLKFSPTHGGLSLYSLMEQFSHLTGEHGGLLVNYVFAENRRFPYHEALLKQRQDQLEHARFQVIEEPEEEKLPELNARAEQQYQWKCLCHETKVQILEQRVESARNALEKTATERASHAESRENRYLEQRKILIGHILRPRLQELRNELKRPLAMNPAIKQSKIQLLERMQELLDSGEPFDKALNTLQNEQPDSLHLLWEGRTRSAMQKIETLCLSGKDARTKVALTLHWLENQRAHPSLHPSRNSNILEERIKAVRYLLALLDTPGYRPTHAIEKFRARNEELFRTLEQYDHALIRQVTSVEEQLALHYRQKGEDLLDVDRLFGKIIIGHQKPPSEPGHKVLHSDRQIERIQEKINELSKEKESVWGFFSSSKKDDKIQMLELLKHRIEKSILDHQQNPALPLLSLKDALEEMSSHQRYLISPWALSSEPKPDTLYVRYHEDTHTLKYMVISPEGELTGGVLTENDLPQIPFPVRTNDPASLRRLLPHLLKITAENGQTWPHDLRSKVHHLHEGRTGKLLKALCKQDLSPTEVLSRLNLEIDRLAMKRSEWLFFRPRARKRELEEQIQALSALKQVIESHPDRELQDTVQTLPPAVIAVLKARAAPFLMELGIPLPQNQASFTPGISSD